VVKAFYDFCLGLFCSSGKLKTSARAMIEVKDGKIKRYPAALEKKAVGLSP